jgi:TatD DNase family protein
VIGTIEYVDAHCHVDLFESPAEILKLIETKRIHTIAVTNAPFVFEFTRKLSEGSQYFHAALGMHPELVEQHGNTFHSMRPLIPTTRFIGEVGLDYVTPSKEVRERQRTIFRQILDDCAAQKDKVITIHSRRSAGDVIDMVGRSFPGTIILHWFSGSQKDLRRGVEFGFYFSVNQTMFDSKSGSAVIDAIPKERLLTETDGPFTKDCGLPAKPDTTIRICGLLGKAWNLSPEEAAKTVRDNFRVAAGVP